MQKDNKSLAYIFFRYTALALLAIGNLKLFYIVFTPLTIYPVYFVLKIMYNCILIGTDTIFIKGYYAQIIPACVAGAAYYFLLILNLTTPMPIRKRIYSILFFFAGFLAVNILRIIVFSNLMFKGYQYFDLTHKLTWYFGSTIFVVFLWFFSVHLFNIKNIPLWTDIKTIVSHIKPEEHHKHGH